MYRNDHNAVFERAQALERELAGAKAERQHDAEHIAVLERELYKARQWLAAAYAQQGGIPRHLPPSNATTALVLGVLSLAICGVLGPFAWHVGNTEIQRMDNGLVDASDRGSAVAGRICGIISTCLLIVAGFVFLFAFSLAGW